MVVVRDLGAPALGGIIYYAAAQLLVTHGVPVFLAVGSAAIPALPVAVVGHVMNVRYDRVVQRRSNHERYVVANAVSPTLQRLKEQATHDSTHFVRSFCYHGRIYDAPQGAPAVVQENVWRWLLEHEPTLAQLQHDYDAAIAAAIELYRREAEPIAKNLIAASGLRPKADDNQMAKNGELRADYAANTLLWEAARAGSTGAEPIWPTGTDRGGSGIELLWDMCILAYGDEAQTKNLIAALHDAVRAPETRAALDRIQARVQAVAHTRDRLIAHLERIEAEDGLHGKCTDCPRFL